LGVTGVGVGITIKEVVLEVVFEEVLEVVFEEVFEVLFDVVFVEKVELSVVEFEVLFNAEFVEFVVLLSVVFVAELKLVESVAVKFVLLFVELL
jgi:hypothetical protein